MSRLSMSLKRLKKTKFPHPLFGKPLTYLTIAVLTAVILIFWSGKATQNQNIEAREVAVILTDSGFSPNEITIYQGDKVTFTTSRNKSFWPASNLHPDHTIYSEFDPRKPIEPEGSWTFQFHKAGRWYYHDHLAPIYTGLVKVLPRDNSSVDSLLSEGSDCAAKDESQGTACYLNLMEGSFKSIGLEKTFDLLAKLYDSQPIFARNCHPYTHKLGQLTYFKFSRNEPLELNGKTSFCGYGFYHGFMETLLGEEGLKYEDVRKFCDLASKEINQSAGLACFHGIGHGFADYYIPGIGAAPTKDEREIVSRSLSLCNKVADQESHELFRCASGLFNSISIAYGSKNLSPNESDPFWLCREQPTGMVRDACYNDIAGVLAYDVLSKKDFPKAIAYAEKVSDDHDAATSAYVITSLHIRDHLGKVDYSEEIGICYTLTKRLWSSCIAGVAGGLMEFGKPDLEYVEANQFCHSTLLQLEEKTSCYRRVMDYSFNIYSADKTREICALTEAAFQKYCPVRS